MGRWSSPSSDDYYNEVEGRTRDGIERTCAGCGEPVMVSRAEVYQVQVFCQPCIERAERRQAETKAGAA